MTGVTKDRKHIGERGLQRHGDDVGAGNHDIADMHLMQGERFQQSALLRRNIVLGRSIGERLRGRRGSKPRRCVNNAQPVEQTGFPLAAGLAAWPRSRQKHVHSLAFTIGAKPLLDQ